MCSQRIEWQMILQKKVDILDKKINDLNAQKKKIETDIAHQLLHVITAHSGWLCRICLSSAIIPKNDSILDMLSRH